MDREIGGAAGLSVDAHPIRPFFLPKSSFSNSCDQETMILNSFDDRVMPRVVNEMDFFGNKNNCSRDATPNAGIKNEAAPDRVELIVNTGLNLLTTSTTGINDKSTADGDPPPKPDNKNEFAVLKSEIDKMNTENQRLRAIFDQVNDKYRALQMHVYRVMQHQKNPKAENSSEDHKLKIDGKPEAKKHRLLLPREFMNLGQLDIGYKDQRSRSRSDSGEQNGEGSGSPPYAEEVSKACLLRKKNNDENSLLDKKCGQIQREDVPEKKAQEWSPNKTPRLHSPNDLDQQATEATMRKARVSVRARSEAPMISDGCQWRKYGQKMAKGNPCPRAYYRCTMGVGCPVRKQVQRCAEDRSILTTTYEGHHNHPLPPAALTMASTTSSAASMLLSGSMPSADGQMNPNILARTLLPCSPNLAATISASAPFPTITLDLTNTSSSNILELQKPRGQFAVPFLNQPHTLQQVLNQSQFSGLQSSQEMMNAATAAITSDPSFTAALVAAITSIMGNAQPNTTSGNQVNTSGNSTESNLENPKYFFQ